MTEKWLLQSNSPRGAETPLTAEAGLGSCWSGRFPTGILTVTYPVTPAYSVCFTFLVSRGNPAPSIRLWGETSHTPVTNLLSHGPTFIHRYSLCPTRTGPCISSGQQGTRCAGSVEGTREAPQEDPVLLLVLLPRGSRLRHCPWSQGQGPAGHGGLWHAAATVFPSVP